MTSAFLQRYEKAHQHCVVFHLEEWAVFRLVGPDTQDYLHRISTADIKQMGAGEARQTLFLGGDGRLVADAVILYDGPEEYRLICNRACRENLAAQVDKYLFTEKVTVEDVSDASYVAMIAGPAAGEAGQGLARICAESGVEGKACDVTLAPGATRVLFITSSEAFQASRAALYDEVSRHGGVIGDVDLYASFRIEAGCPEYGKDTNEKTIPLEAGLKPAISFTKGCFPGQEIVARINNLGHPANVLVGLALPETTEELVGRELISNGKVVGRITSVCYSPVLKGTLGLGYVKWNMREAGQVLDVAGDEIFQGQVVELPLPGVSA